MILSQQEPPRHLTENPRANSPETATRAFWRRKRRKTMKEETSERRRFEPKQPRPPGLYLRLLLQSEPVRPSFQIPINPFPPPFLTPTSTSRLLFCLLRRPTAVARSAFVATGPPSAPSSSKTSRKSLRGPTTRTFPPGRDWPVRRGSRKLECKYVWGRVSLRFE